MSSEQRTAVIDGEIDLNGRIFDVEGWVSYNYVTDHNYGADYDGNRGETRSWCEDVEFGEIAINVSRDSKKPKWVAISDLRRFNQGRIEEAIEKKGWSGHACDPY